MAQACHGALEAGISFGSILTHPASIIILGVKNQNELFKAHKYCTDHGIKTAMFFEPDWNYGETSFGTEPLQPEQWSLMRRYRLWRP